MVNAILLVFANLDYLKTANAALFLKENLTVLPMFIPTVTALASRKRWVQWAAGALLSGHDTGIHDRLLRNT